MSQSLPYKLQRPSKPRRRGFTLVEMLVAVGLVVLMMLLFAQVFQTAAGLVSNMKGKAELDQDVRTMTILLRGDIGQRTFREVVPFYPGQDTEGASNYEPKRREGFFSISENDPDDPTDDVLHLTIKVNEGEAREGSPQLPFSGKASLIRRADPNNGIPPDPPDEDIDSEAEGAAYLYGDPNDATRLPNLDQPEFDDGQLSLNGTGSSRYMEVCWFLRDGILYRRALLIRERYATVSGSDPQPTNANGDSLVPGDYTAANVPPPGTWHNGSGEFWRDFDYSAYYEPNGGLRFHGQRSMLNANSATPAANPNLLNLPPSLGLPFLRFGSSTSRASVNNGALMIQGPRESLTPGATDNLTGKENYIGRFTIQETSHSNFNYPGNINAGDPFDDNTALVKGSDGLVSAFSDEMFRRGEDIVMTNVHSFDIQVWDDGLSPPAFVNLGHGGGGHYGSTANTDYGNRYDTWHPFPAMPEPPYPNPYPLDGGVPPELGSADEVPLRAILIRIRFYDVGSEQLRDLTFTFPLKK